MGSSGTQGKNDIVAQAPDQPTTPQQVSGQAGGDFAFAVYAQLAAIQREIGALSMAHNKLEAHVKDSEVRVTDRVRESETRLTELGRDSEKRVLERIDKFDSTASDRMKTAEDKLSKLKETVNRVFWMGTGIILVLGGILGWKPIWAWISTHLLK